MGREIMPSRRIGLQEPKLSEASKRVEAGGEVGGLGSTAEWDQQKEPKSDEPWTPLGEILGSPLFRNGGKTSWNYSTTQWRS